MLFKKTTLLVPKGVANRFPDLILQELFGSGSFIERMGGHLFPLQSFVGIFSHLNAISVMFM